jgi:hypothetical protein
VAKTASDKVQNTRRWEKAHPEKFKADRKARSKVNNAVRDGEMKKPAKADACPNCGKRGFRKEHDHQSKPPKWKCSACHARGGAA